MSWNAVTARLLVPAPLWLHPGRVTFAGLGAALTLLAVLAAFTGAAFWKISVGPFHLFAYRLLLLGLWLYLLTGALYTGAPVVPASLRRVHLALGFLGVWLVYSVLNIGFVRELADYVTHVVFIAMGVSLVFFVTVFLGRSERLRWFYWLWLAVLAALIVMGLAQSLFSFQLAISQFAGVGVGDGELFTPMGTFPRVNQYAAFLALGAAFPLALLTTRHAWRATLAAVALLAGIVGLLIELGARVALLGVAVQLAVALHLVGGQRQRVRLRAVAVALLGVAIISAVFFYAFDGFSRVSEQLQSRTGSLGVRWNLTINGLLFARDSAGLGVGAGNFNAWIEATDYRPTLYEGIGNHQTITYPHNWWVELLAEYGVVIAAAFITFYAGLVVAVVRVYRRAAGRLQRRLGQALIMALAGYPVIALAPGHFAAFRPQWVLLAMVLAYVVAAPERDAPAASAP